MKHASSETNSVKHDNAIRNIGFIREDLGTEKKNMKIYPCFLFILSLRLHRTKKFRMINLIHKKVCDIFLTFVGCGISECQIRLSILIPAPDRGGQFAETSGLINHMERSVCFI